MKTHNKDPCARVSLSTASLSTAPPDPQVVPSPHPSHHQTPFRLREDGPAPLTLHRGYKIQHSCGRHQRPSVASAGRLSDGSEPFGAPKRFLHLVRRIFTRAVADHSITLNSDAIPIGKAVFFISYSSQALPPRVHRSDQPFQLPLHLKFMPSSKAPARFTTPHRTAERAAWPTFSRAIRADFAYKACRQHNQPRCVQVEEYIPMGL